MWKTYAHFTLYFGNFTSFLGKIAIVCGKVEKVIHIFIKIAVDNPFFSTKGE